MNRAFDYNGVQIAPSKPVQKLVTRKRILHIDSADRDMGLYHRNGNFIVYLPRAYERVKSINIKSAEFPETRVGQGSTINMWTGCESSGTGTAFDTAGLGQPKYFFLEAQGLNMSDETANLADRSASTNSVFAKFVVTNPSDSIVIYNESSSAHQTIEFFPALTKLDRFHFRIRTHHMNSNQYMYWPSGEGIPPEWSISLEIETLENAFDEFSSIETRIGDRS
jgi:hypothetical protein